MPFPINIIAGWLLKKGVNPDSTGPVAWVLAIVGAIIAFIIGMTIYNAWVIDTHETEQRAEKAEKTIEQIERAEETDEQLRDRDDQAIDDMEDERNDADVEDPSRTREPVDPGTSAIHDRMRRHTGSPR